MTQGSQKPGESLIRDARMIRVSSDKEATMPMSIAATQHHFLVLFPQKLVAFRKEDEAIVLNVPITSEAIWGLKRVSPDFALDGFIRDGETSTLWIRSSREVWSVEIGDETAEMWRVFLTKALRLTGANEESRSYFEAAAKHCRNKRQRLVVHNERAKYLFENREFVQAAKYYRLTDRKFEDIVQLFLNTNGAEDALSVYVDSVLKSIAPPAPAALQRTSLGTYLAHALTTSDLARRSSSMSSSVLTRTNVRPTKSYSHMVASAPFTSNIKRRDRGAKIGCNHDETT